MLPPPWAPPPNGGPAPRLGRGAGTPVRTDSQAGGTVDNSGANSRGGWININSLLTSLRADSAALAQVPNGTLIVGLLGAVLGAPGGQKFVNWDLGVK